jgi:hypothetical protein
MTLGSYFVSMCAYTEVVAACTVGLAKAKRVVTDELAMAIRMLAMPQSD